MSKFATVWRYCTSDGIPRRSAVVAMVVGTALNLINQGDALVTGGPIDFVKVALTYIVPYCVATYGAVSFRRTSLSRAREEAKFR